MKRSDAAGFEVLPKRWIVERSSPGSVAIAVWLVISNATRPQAKYCGETLPEIVFADD